MSPNLFIIGAPKCGTSSLFEWLAEHPEIRGSQVKEPFFLTDPAHPLSRRPNLVNDGVSAYDELFLPGDEDFSFRMEATTHYIYDPIARLALASVHDARIIVILREPAKRVFSSFQYTFNNLARLSPKLTFSRYLSLLEAGERLFPKWCRHEGSAFVLERDVEYSRYIRYIAPLMDVVNNDRVKFIIMEKMISDPDGTVVDLLQWLGLETDCMTLASRVGRNRTEYIRIPQLQAIVRTLNASIRPPEAVRVLAKRAYGALQYREAKSNISIEDTVALRRLQASYEFDNAKLSDFLKLDLSSWALSD